MSLQAVRALYEVPVMNACATYGVPVVAENQAYTGGSSSKEECRMSMSFGDITVQTLGESLETLNGTFVVQGACDACGTDGIGAAQRSGRDADRIGTEL